MHHSVDPGRGGGSFNRKQPKLQSDRSVSEQYLLGSCCQIAQLLMELYIHFEWAIWDQICLNERPSDYNFERCNGDIGDMVEEESLHGQIWFLSWKNMWRFDVADWWHIIKYTLKFHPSLGYHPCTPQLFISQCRKFWLFPRTPQSLYTVCLTVPVPLL